MTEPDLTEGGLLKALAQLATPMLVTAVLQNVQSLIDLFWVGHLGPEAVAAVAMSATVLMVLFPMLMGISTGTLALVARGVGARRLDEAGAAASQSLVLSTVLGGVSGVAGWFLSDDLLRLLGAEPGILSAAGAYLRISLLGSFTVFVLFIAGAALQGAGDAVRPMYIMGATNLANIGLAPLFIFGLGPVPAMGVAGAALATVLAQALGAALSVYILCSGRARLHLHLSRWRPDFALMWRIARIGIPGAGQMLSRSLMSAVLMRIVASCGALAVAAYGVGMRLHIIILMPAFALGGAAATLVGQNLGAGKPRRANQAAWLATAVDVAFMVVAGTAAIVFAPYVIRFFNSDPTVVQVGSDYLRTVSPVYVLAALGIVLGRALNGAGDSLSPMIITFICLWVLQVPLAIWFSRIWEPATQGIWWSIVIAIGVQGLLTAAWFATGRWKTTRV